MFNNMLVPKYVQLQNIIKEKIITKQYSDGEKIPSETEFMEKYSVTRTTIRKALSNLVYEGLLRKEQGKGTFVSFFMILLIVCGILAVLQIMHDLKKKYRYQKFFAAK